MSNKDKLGLDRIVNRINKEFEKTSDQFDKLVSDAFKQLDNLQSQIHEPIKKIMEDMDKIRDREITRFQSEFDKRMQEFSDLQAQLLDKLGMESKKSSPKANTSAVKRSTPSTTRPAKAATKTKPATRKKPAAKKAPAKKAPARKPATKAATKTTAKSTAKTNKSTTTAPKTAVSKAKARPAPVKKTGATKKTAAPKTATKTAAKKTQAAKASTGSKANELTKLNGVGPALAKRLNDAGIKSLKQIANPSDADKKTLAEFGKVKGYTSWQDKAKELTS